MAFTREQIEHLDTLARQLGYDDAWAYAESLGVRRNRWLYGAPGSLTNEQRNVMSDLESRVAVRTTPATPLLATERQIDYVLALQDRAGIARTSVAELQLLTRDQISGMIDGLKERQASAVAQARRDGRRYGLTGEIWDH